MKKLATLALTSIAILLTACTGANAAKNTVRNVNEIAPYPEAEAGYVRSVIYLPQLKNEQDAKVELLIGKQMTTDCNFRSLAGKVKLIELKGWGYQYLTVSEVTNGISTLMACPPDFEGKSEFVTIKHSLGLMDYNSRLPIVVYNPEDVQVKYRIWSNSGKTLTATIE